MIDYSSSTSSGAFEPADDDLTTLPVWAFTLGLLAVLTTGLTSVPAIICGHRALAAANGPNDESLGRYMSIIGLVVGYLGAALLGTWVILLAEFLAAY